MDPNQTFLDMFEAMKNEDFETARELALALQNWFAKGGFCPPKFTRRAMQTYIDSVLRGTSGRGHEPVFSLICQHCDAGQGITTEELAIAEGWSEIEPAFDLPKANHSGICPDCRKTEEA